MNGPAQLDTEKEDMNSTPIADATSKTSYLFKVFYFGCVVLLLVEIDMQLTNLFFKEHRHQYHSWEALLAFYPIYAFGGIVLLVLIAKVLRRLLMRPEDYYDV